MRGILEHRVGKGGWGVWEHPDKVYFLPLCQEQNNDSYIKGINKWYFDEVEYIILPEDKAKIRNVVEHSLQTWNDILDDYRKEEYPVHGGPFIHSISLEEWLIRNYQPPKPK